MKPLNETIKNLGVILDKLWYQIPVSKAPVTDIKYLPCGYKSGSTLPSTENFLPFGENDTWGFERDQHVWFAFTVDATHLKGQEFKLEISTQITGWDATNPQFIAYVDGKIRQGLDTNHTYLILSGQDKYEIMLYAYSGMEAQRQSLRLNANIIIENLDVKKLYYDVNVPFGALSFLDENTYEYQNIAAILERAVNRLNMLVVPSEEFYKSVVEADKQLQKEFYSEFCKGQDIKSICIRFSYNEEHFNIIFMKCQEKFAKCSQKTS